MKVFLFFILFCIFFIFNMSYLIVRLYGEIIFGLKRTFVCVILSIIYSLSFIGLIMIIKNQYIESIKIYLIWFIIIFAIGFFFGKILINNYEIYGLSRLIWIFLLVLF